MSLEEYIRTSKTSIEDLIQFAKKEKMGTDVIRGLFKHIKPYKMYKTPFFRNEYLKSTILIIDGNEVRPTEEDVDRCVEYLKATDALICDKTVRDTIRKFLRGEIDITISEEGKQREVSVEEVKEVAEAGRKGARDGALNVVTSPEEEKIQDVPSHNDE